MARYIDADELLNNLPDDLPYKASVKRVLIQAPTADVVPKNEVEQLERNLKQCENGYRQEMHLLQCKLADEQSKVGEIFEEIDDITDLFAKGLIDELEMYDKLAELKKKYTKSEDKG